MHRVDALCCRSSRGSSRAASGSVNIDIISTNSKPSYDWLITVSYSLTRFANNYNSSYQCCVNTGRAK